MIKILSTKEYEKMNDRIEQLEDVTTMLICEHLSVEDSELREHWLEEYKIARSKYIKRKEAAQHEYK